ncbi:unnamed protein product [Fraxinus pennsylvanica]|uniref:Uncharacterized protein n=1 Tax=Fraxinus pennsylvanica TaxID=56036 RepID=A0AAD2DZX5_9LAMI|nr:unnamed protein product [Fraxinus pennsylvanica]
MVVGEVVSNYGGIDILVTNAAEQHLSNNIEEITEDRLLKFFRTNIFYQFFMVRHAFKHMKEGTSIINSTSGKACCGSPMVLDYSSTKGAIVAFTRAVALHLVIKGNLGKCRARRTGVDPLAGCVLARRNDHKIWF